MKPAREPPSSSPRPCAALKKPHESCPFAAPCGPRKKKNDRGQKSAFPQKPPGSRFRFSRTGVQPSPGSSTTELPSAFAESGAYPPDRELPGSPRQCSLPLACRHPPEGHQIGARKKRTPENTIFSQPYCRRVSTDRPDREGSQLTTSLEGEPGPTPAGKSLSHSYPETRFRRERARGHCVCKRSKTRWPVTRQVQRARTERARRRQTPPARSARKGYTTVAHVGVGARLWTTLRTSRATAKAEIAPT